MARAIACALEVAVGMAAKPASIVTFRTFELARDAAQLLVAPRASWRRPATAFTVAQVVSKMSLSAAHGSCLCRCEAKSGTLRDGSLHLRHALQTRGWRGWTRNVLASMPTPLHRVCCPSMRIST